MRKGLGLISLVIVLSNTMKQVTKTTWTLTRTYNIRALNSSASMRTHSILLTHQNSIHDQKISHIVHSLLDFLHLTHNGFNNFAYLFFPALLNLDGAAAAASVSKPELLALKVCWKFHSRRFRAYSHYSFLLWLHPTLKFSVMMLFMHFPIWILRKFIYLSLPFNTCLTCLLEIRPHTTCEWHGWLSWTFGTAVLYLLSCLSIAAETDTKRGRKQTGRQTYRKTNR